MTAQQLFPWKTELIEVEQLLIDGENPRLASATTEAHDQDALVKVLWDEMAVDEVALSIAANGFFREEALFVIPKAGTDKFLVVEGNRRLAAVQLLRNQALRNKVGANDLPPISAAARRALDRLPVSIYQTRQELWEYFGFRHINGPQAWDAYAKAKYVATVHDAYHVALKEIARKIGDRHSIVQRLYNGYQLLQQAQERTGFDTDDVTKSRFYFSHLYTAIKYPEFRHFVGIPIGVEEFKHNPVPRGSLSNLSELMLWIFGSRSRDVQPLVKTQSPDLNTLREVIKTQRGIAALRRGVPLNRAYEISIGDERRFREALTLAKEHVQQAKATVTTGYKGQSDLFELIAQIVENCLVRSGRDEIDASKGCTVMAPKTPKGIPFPPNFRDPIDLADWMELLALSADDGNGSRADLQAALTRSGAFDPRGGAPQIEPLTLAVFNELEARVKAAADAYPFEVSHPLVVRKDGALRCYPAYIFCLCLSAWRWINPRERPSDARRLFEDLSCVAAKSFVGGEVLRFAHPRSREIKGFKKAVEHLCRQIGEGGGFKKGQLAGRKKDSTLDVVAWRHFPDGRSGKLMVFGQCASGGDWASKRRELDPRTFVGLWFGDALVSECLRAFFVPHRVGDAVWNETQMLAGLTFDRCRLAYWAHQAMPLPKRRAYVAWCKSVIPKR